MASEIARLQSQMSTANSASNASLANSFASEVARTGSAATNNAAALSDEDSFIDEDGGSYIDEEEGGSAINEDSDSAINEDSDSSISEDSGSDNEDSPIGSSPNPGPTDPNPGPGNPGPGYPGPGYPGPGYPGPWYPQPNPISPLTEKTNRKEPDSLVEYVGVAAGQFVDWFHDHIHAVVGAFGLNPIWRPIEEVLLHRTILDPVERITGYDIDHYEGRMGEGYEKPNGLTPPLFPQYKFPVGYDPNQNFVGQTPQAGDPDPGYYGSKPLLIENDPAYYPNPGYYNKVDYSQPQVLPMPSTDGKPPRLLDRIFGGLGR
jgi:hypothetical protein